MVREATRSASVAAAATAAVVAAGLGLSGCGRAAATSAGSGKHLGANEQASPVPASRLNRRPPASVARGALPPAGSSQQVDAAGARLTVTLRRVIDPLRRSGARLPAGTRAVGVIIQIRSAGPGVYDSSATGDVRIVVSRGAITPVLATRGICRTPLNDFDRFITSGEDRVGCVVFAVADGATLDAVRFFPHARRPGRLSWAP